MSRYAITARARQDLRGIYRFIAIERQSPESAERQLEFLFDKFRFLAMNPEMGEIRNDLRPGLRVFIAKTYVIFYRIRTGGVSITRVMHGRRNWADIL
jgi:plasmid stabilization system protein ParE